MALPVLRPDRDAMKLYMVYAWSLPCCPSRKCCVNMSDLLNGRGIWVCLATKDLSLWSCQADFYLSWGIWGSRPIPSVSLLLRLIPCTGLAELQGMTENWHKATTCDLIRAPGVLALFCFIFPSAAISFKNVDDFHLFPREQWSIFDLPTLIKTSKVANFCY